jgi:hypothetical protein
MTGPQRAAYRAAKPFPGAAPLFKPHDDPSKPEHQAPPVGGKEAEQRAALAEVVAAGDALEERISALASRGMVRVGARRPAPGPAPEQRAAAPAPAQPGESALEAELREARARLARLEGRLEEVMRMRQPASEGDPPAGAGARGANKGKNWGDGVFSAALSRGRFPAGAR